MDGHHYYPRSNRLLHQLACISLLCLTQFYPGPNRMLVSGTDAQDAYYRLFYDLMDPSLYKKQIRPAQSTMDPLVVYLDFELISIADVDEKGQRLETAARLKMTWNDDYLSWNASNYMDIDTMFVPQENVYLPDIVLANSVSKQRQLGFDELPVRIDSDGSVSWEPTQRISTDCDIDIMFFPFESQKCSIEFETAISTTDEIEVNIIQGRSSIILDHYGINSQWELEETAAAKLENQGGKSKIKFTLLIKRRRTFYLMNIVLPVFFLSMTASLVFALPVEEGEKMGTSITVLLAFAVYLTIVADTVPNSSINVSILALYLAVLLGLSSLSTVLAVMVLRLHHRDDEWPVGRKTSGFIRFLNACLDPSGPKQKTDESQMMARPSPGPEENNNGRGGRHPVQNPEEQFYMGQMPRRPYYINDSRSSRQTMYHQGNPEEMNQRADNNNQKHTKAQQKSAPDRQPMIWKHVANTLDLLFFVLFSFCSVAATLGCLLYLHFGAEAYAPKIESSSSSFP